MSKFVAIDEDGYFLLDNGLRFNDAQAGLQMLSGLTVDNFGVTHLNFQGQDIVVEPFDKPYVVQQVLIEGQSLILQMPYQFFVEADLESLCLDEWDRFHGITINQVPFVMTHKAQAELFNLCSNFNDESIEVGSQKISTHSYYFKNTGVESESFWSEKYQQQTTPWDLDRPHPELDTTLAQLKLNKMRVLVPGCGSGHDAAFLAEKGHVVTAIDFSPTAIEQAQKKYGDRPNLTFLEGDVFNLDDSHTGAYDLVFEHTCYCAIDPSQRSMLIKQWKRFLDETGHLLGIFFAVPKRTGPYFGGSEWELREKLKKDFQFYYWTRLRHSPDWRRGAELLIYGRKN